MTAHTPIPDTATLIAPITTTEQACATLADLLETYRIEATSIPNRDGSLGMSTRELWPTRWIDPKGAWADIRPAIDAVKAIPGAWDAFVASLPTDAEVAQRNRAADPVFAAIAEHKTQFKRVTEGVAGFPRTCDPTQEDDWNEILDDELTAFRDMVTTQPTTLAGAAALIAQVASYPDAEHHSDALATAFETLNDFFAHRRALGSDNPLVKLIAEHDRLAAIECDPNTSSEENTRVADIRCFTVMRQMLDYSPTDIPSAIAALQFVKNTFDEEHCDGLVWPTDKMTASYLEGTLDVLRSIDATAPADGIPVGWYMVSGETFWCEADIDRGFIALREMPGAAPVWYMEPTAFKSRAVLPVPPNSRNDADLIALGCELEASWDEDARAADREPDNHEGDAKLDAQLDVTGAIVDRIEAMTATTLEGLRVKARACQWCIGPKSSQVRADPKDTTMDEVIAFSIVGDLLGESRA